MLQEPITVRDIVLASRFVSDENYELIPFEESISFTMMLPHIDIDALRKSYPPESISVKKSVSTMPKQNKTIKKTPAIGVREKSVSVMPKQNKTTKKTPGKI